MKIVEKLQKRIQEGKKNNKGFSLVELIIVIAIMAILIGIVGMNVIPQIENARRSKDEQVLSAYLTEAMEALTQNAASLENGVTYVITIDEDGVSCANEKIESTFKELSGASGLPNFESKKASEIETITINCQVGDSTKAMVTLETGVPEFGPYTSNDGTAVTTDGGDDD